LGSCKNEQPPEWRTPDAIFPLLESEYPTRISAAPQNPQLVQHLIMQQRELFMILIGNQRAHLHDYLAATFVWRYATSEQPRVRATQRSPVPAASLPARVAGNRHAVDYLALLGGIDGRALSSSAWLS
jgi:hypothetical protein